jgi:drug/metabolite transporter (DMT)-like permease
VKPKSLLPYVWMLCGSLAFALMGTLVHALGERCDWQLTLLARSLLPLLLALGMTVATGARLVLWRPGTLWVRSTAGSISMVCTFYVLTRLPVSEVFTLTNTFPIWVAVLSWPLLSERPSARVWVAVAVGVIGVVLVEQPHVGAGSLLPLLALGAAVCTAVAMLGLHRLRDLDVWAIVVHFSGVSLLFCVAAFFLFDRQTSLSALPDGLTLWMLLGVGVSATVGQLFLTKAFAAGPPAQVSVVALTQIVFAVGFDVLLWHHSFDSATLLGMGLVIAPTAWLMAYRG